MGLLTWCPTRCFLAQLAPSEARELKELREENVKLKRLVADLPLDYLQLYRFDPKVPLCRAGEL